MRGNAIKATVSYYRNFSTKNEDDKCALTIDENNVSNHYLIFNAPSKGEPKKIQFQDSYLWLFVLLVRLIELSWML